jgi:hypothetical protein
MTEKVSHVALTTHSAPFTLNGNIYTATLQGTIVHGTDAISLQRFVNGAFMSDGIGNVKFNALSNGGTVTFTAPAGTYRWTVPGNGHSVSTTILAGSG